MVPGMIERERLAADLRRAAWLADAAHGPMLDRTPSERFAVSVEPRQKLQPGKRRILAALAITLGAGIRRLRRAPTVAQERGTSIA
jgi:hypothetical protein